MEYINVDENNIDNEHICCAISASKKDSRALSKKEWMKNNYSNGLTFVKLNERGKVFIEYLPADKAWAPIDANGYMYINCFWVSGKFAKQGHGNNLLNHCINDAKDKGMKGLVILSASKKMPFLSEGKYLKKKGFIIADSTFSNYELLYLPFSENKDIPKFKKGVTDKISEEGMVIQYSNQCPHTELYANELKTIAIENNLDIKLIKLNNYTDAQNSSVPFTTYSFFDKGVFVTNEIYSSSKFTKYLKNRENN